eukprot:357488-Chlamydomonas_euryale.AAC.9
MQADELEACKICRRLSLELKPAESKARQVLPALSRDNISLPLATLPPVHRPTLNVWRRAESAASRRTCCHLEHVASRRVCSAQCTCPRRVH